MNEFRPQGGAGRTAGRRHETADARLRIAAVFAVGLLATAVALHFGLAAYLGKLGATARAADPPRRPAAAPMRPSGVPPLQTSPGEDLRRLREAEDAALRSYGWVDRARGRVRLPVDRAVELLLERGFPAREEGR